MPFMAPLLLFLSCDLPLLCTRNDSCADCDAVLAIEQDNPKALFRRGRALLLLDHPAEAKADLMRAARLMPSNKAIRSELELANTKLESV